MMNEAVEGHPVGHAHVSSKVTVKYRVGLNILAFLQFIFGLLMLNFEAVCTVLYRVSDKNYLYGVEYLGMVVGISGMVTSIFGKLATRRSGPHSLRMCFHICNIIFTVFLSVETFAMACISAALLALYTISWDTVLEFVNRLSQSVELNLAVGTTTTTVRSASIQPILAQELTRDFSLLVGLRCVLFSMYFIIFVASVVSSCFSCCNYCKCWAIREDDRRVSHHFEEHIHAHAQVANSGGQLHHRSNGHAVEIPHSHSNGHVPQPPAHAKQPVKKTKQTSGEEEPEITAAKSAVSAKKVVVQKPAEPHKN